MECHAINLEITVFGVIATLVGFVLFSKEEVSSAEVGLLVSRKKQPNSSLMLRTFGAIKIPKSAI